MCNDKRRVKRQMKRQSIRVKKQELRERIRKIQGQHVFYLPLYYAVMLVFGDRLFRQAAANDDKSAAGITKKGKLTLEERQWLYLYKSHGLGVREVARLLRRAASTVSRELSRNRYSSPYFAFLDSYSKAKAAHDETKRRRSAKRKRLRLKSGKIRRMVIALLKKKFSPEAISGRLRSEKGFHISYQAIYEFIILEHPELKQYLVRAGKKYRRRGEAKRKRARKQPAAPKLSIDTRPKAVAERRVFGHWEMDTIVSRQSKQCLLVIQERVSRYFFVVKLPECSADAAFSVVLRLLKPLVAQGLVKSMTCDNGSENWCHDRITAALGIPVYFCHPYCSSERGGVENRNGTIRRYFPKKTDFSRVSDEEVAAAWEALINRPMKCLDYYTPYEIFTGTFTPLLKDAA